MVFICQFAFHDSLDLFEGKNLPGDVLLVFAPDEYPSLDDDGRCFEFEWYRRGLHDLVDTSSIPPAQQTFEHLYYGLRHRTVDYELSQPAESLIERVLGPDKYGRLPVGWSARLWDATKIGGIPFLTGTDWSPPGAHTTFLCTFTSINGCGTIADPGAFRLNDRSQKDLCWYDGFRLSIFLAADDSTVWDFDVG